MPANIIKTDNFEGQLSLGARKVRLYLTSTSGVIGDWIAVHAGNTANAGAVDGQSYRVADVANADATFDTVGVLLETVAAAGYYMVQVSGRVNANVTSSASVASGDKLAIGSTAGRAVEYTGTDPTLRVIATCRSTPASNLADVDINVHPAFAA